MRLEKSTAAGALLALLAGCSLGTALGTAEHADVEAAKPRSDAGVIADYLETMRKLSHSDPAVQAEIFQQAREAADLTPTTANRLRYALALATPGHGGTDAGAAQKRLAQLLASPELLLPPEQALAEVELRQVELRIVLTEENRRMQQEAVRLDRDHTTAAARRLQTEIDENKRLRKELEEAQAKLDAVTHIEQRSTLDRNPNGNKP
jgi:N-acetylmuramoyl-L-alanine amidase